MAKVTCIVLDTSVTLPTERGNNITFNKGDTLMILFANEDNDTKYVVCSAGGGMPFIWVAKNSKHKRVEMELSEWQQLNKLRKPRRFAMLLTGS